MSKFPLSAAVLTLCLLLTSCSAGQVPEGGSSSPEAGAVLEESPPLPSASPAQNGEAYALVVPCEETVRGSGNQNGYYQVLQNADGSHSAVFIDYQTRRQIYLCADANCTHNTERCSAWFAAEDAQIWPIAWDDQIFFVHNSQTSPSYIEKANPDGSDRQMLYRLPGEGSIRPGAACKEGYLAFLETRTESEGESVRRTDRLIAVNTHTGEPTVLFENGSPESPSQDTGSTSAFFQGVTTHGFIVKLIEIGPTPDVQRHSVYEIPFDGSAPHELVSFETGEMQGLPHGSGWYYLQTDPASRQLQLGCIDSATGENRLVAADLQETIPVTSLGDVFIRNFVEDWIIINAMTSLSLDGDQNIELHYSCYAVHATTGEIRSLTLFNEYHETRVPLEIYDEWGDKLLVQASVDEIAPDEPGMVMTQLTSALALLSKEEYLASTPAYEWIEML